MRGIKIEDLKNKLTEEIVDLLARMSMEIPVSAEWIKITQLLTIEQRISINNRISEIQRVQEKIRDDAMTEDEKAIEEIKWKKVLEDDNPHSFYGNMGQPETPQEFKNRYGVWPPGYDDDGNKI